MARIGIVGFMHESNTFASTPTTRKHFEEAHLDFGEDLVPTWKEAHHELGGFLAGCEKESLEAVPILAGWATPTGPLTKECYEEILCEILKGLDQAGPLNGLLLALHGAMVAEGFDSADGETVTRIREHLGEGFPIVMTLDMHGNVSLPMVECPDATIIYRTYPHIDQRERGLEAAALIARMVRGECRPRQAMVKPPLLVHIVQQYSEAGPMKRVMDKVREIASSPGILSASFAPGFIYADVPDMGASAVVVADRDLELAKQRSRELAEFAFSLREELNADLPSPEEAVREAAQIPGPVSLMDCGDNVGGGGPGDSTHLFAEILRQGHSGCCVVLYDPECAKICSEKGVGASVSLEVGGKTDDRHGVPIPINGTVRTISDGKYEETEPRHGGSRYLDQGLTAVVDTEDGHTVALNSLRVMPTSLQQLLSLSIEPKNHRFLIVKGVTAPRGAYEPISNRVIAVDTPGVTQAGPESFTFIKRPAPLYPLDEVPSGD
ncbi:MAG: M81 family metallopeptidase [Candidatus Omnitrophica bacterium]|nr:M81 family metallopeptidase [Candidatus Omnitrophota bacterium]